MVALPPTTDLGVVEAEMTRRGVFPEVAAKIRQALTAASCGADLLHATQCLNALRKLPELDPFAIDEDLRSARYALLTTAVALYARATSTSGSKGERGSIQIVDALTPDQREDHEAIVSVRNQVLAHVYTNETIAGADWHGVKVILAEYNGYVTPTVITLRLMFDETLLDRLERQTPIALELVNKRAGIRQTEIIHAMEKVRSPSLDELLQLGVTDFQKVVGGDYDEAVRQASELRARLAEYIPKS